MTGSKVRHSRAHPCPVCGGYDGLPRGKAERCCGWTSDGWCNCSREEFAGTLARNENSSTYAHRLSAPCLCGRDHGGEPSAVPVRANGNGHTGGAKTYTYHNEAGAPVFQVVRTPDKRFFQQRPDGHGGWINGLDGVSPTLYHLPELLAVPPGEAIYVVEGEKDCDRLRGSGLFATTSPMGAGKWRPEYNQYLAGRRVVIIGDNDEPGRMHARTVAANLHGIAATVTLVELPGVPEKGDVSDWLNLPGNDRAALTALVSATPVWSPPLVTAAAGTGQTTSEAWTPPVPFEEVALPSFPTEVLPGWLRDTVDALSEFSQTPPDLAGMVALAVLGLCCGRGVRVRCWDGYFEPTNIFTAVAMPPGSRKSSVFASLMEPVVEYQRLDNEANAAEIASAQSRLRVAQKRLERAEAAAAKAARNDEEGANDDLDALAQDVALLLAKLPYRMRLFADDITPEAIAGLLQQQGESLALMSAEGGIFDILAGRYSKDKAPNLDAFLKGHSGDMLLVDRVGRPPEYIVHPALTVGLAVQPDVIRALADKPGFRGRGLLGRFLYSLPPSNLGYRKIVTAPVPESVKDAYQARVMGLLGLGVTVDEHGRPSRHVISLSGEASAHLRGFAAWVEPLLIEGAGLDTISDWASKLTGAVARIAAGFHMATYETPEHALAWPVDAATVERAITIGHYLVPHAKAAFAVMGADPALEDARYVLKRITDRHVESFTQREMWLLCRGPFQTVEPLAAALKVLCDRGYLREREQAGQGARGGRPTSAIFDVNPYGSKRSERSKPPQ